LFSESGEEFQYSLNSNFCFVLLANFHLIAILIKLLAGWIFILDWNKTQDQCGLPDSFNFPHPNDCSGLR
jgi:hypothetical protein